MRAEPLEKFVQDAAITLLTNLTINPLDGNERQQSGKEESEIAEDEQQLRDLHDMWLSKEIDSAEYRRDRRVIQARIRESEKKTVVKVEQTAAIADLIGPGAKAAWTKLSDERKNAVLRFLFLAPSSLAMARQSGSPNSIDYSRIEIEETQLA